jgi:hypothetical protein
VIRQRKLARRALPADVSLNVVIGNGLADSECHRYLLDRSSRKHKPTVAVVNAGAYPSLIDPEGGTDELVASYGPEGYARLQRVKARYDPENVFRSNKAIEPVPSSPR